MAYWGIAYASGPNYNKPWEAFDPADLDRSIIESRAAIEKAQIHCGNSTVLERALIGALAMRCPAKMPANMGLTNDAYAAAMAEVYRSFPSHPDVATLYAEAMMNRTAWQLWDIKKGKPAPGSDTPRIMEVLERAMAENSKPHPGILHMYIHTMEMSSTPERALRAADQLRNLVPDAGHLQHMPTHIDILCGHYNAAVEWNEAAIAADLKYVERQGSLNFYSVYRCHNYHFKSYGAMFLGQYQPAIEAARDMVASLPEELLRVESPPMADWLEAFVPTEFHVLIRFGKWREIIAKPFPRDRALFAFTMASQRYARAIAFAATGDVSQAKQEAAQFEADAAQVPETRKLMNNFCKDILAIAREMMLGEIAYREGDYETAFDHLRRSIMLDDNLPYDEPWGWMQPVRHALGALLLEQNQVEDAAEVYRADLGLDAALPRACQHPDNVWSLHGYYECLHRLGQKEEARLIKQRLDLANARTDTPVKASCFCKLGSSSK
jgi:tetratricopeptide (TPR) repeat protein